MSMTAMAKLSALCHQDALSDTHGSARISVQYQQGIFTLLRNNPCIRQSLLLQNGQQVRQKSESNCMCLGAYVDM